MEILSLIPNILNYYFISVLIFGILFFYIINTYDKSVISLYNKIVKKKYIIQNLSIKEFFDFKYKIINNYQDNNLYLLTYLICENDVEYITIEYIRYGTVYKTELLKSSENIINKFYFNKLLSLLKSKKISENCYLFTKYFLIQEQNF
jgi:hypothetical protein